MGDYLLIGGAKMGMGVRLCPTEGFWPNEEIVDYAGGIAKQTEARMTLSADLDPAVDRVNFVYTDVWLSMGEYEDECKERIRRKIGCTA
jgi:ornithine carbamoyltransferase